jgi:hypothetical protein
VLAFTILTLPVITLLTSFSYTEKPKYRCPRCKTQTCSLTCYKRHQQRASCNGQRDPAAYLKRSEWATPSGIDRDYNYLKSVERHVDSTGKDVRERGIATGDSGRGGERGAASNKKVSKSWIPGSALQKYLSENSIMVEKAPTGMSRQKANLTRVTHKGNVMWTVEWVDVDGKKSVDDECSEGRQINDLWNEVSAKRLNAEKGRKRKRETEKQSVAQKSSVQASEQQPSDDAGTLLSQPGPESVGHSSSKPAEDKPIEPVPQKPEDLPSDRPGDETVMDPSNAIEKNTVHSEKSLDDEKPTTPEYFYLLKPFTASKSNVLIPIDSSGKLTECLRGQTVLEFPTVYVLPNTPNALPAGFMLEERYNKMQKAEQVEVDGLLQRTNESTGGALSASREEEKPLDANSILDMLKRDVGV